MTQKEINHLWDLWWNWANEDESLMLHDRRAYMTLEVMEYLPEMLLRLDPKMNWIFSNEEPNCVITKSMVNAWLRGEDMMKYLPKRLR